MIANSIQELLTLAAAQPTQDAEKVLASIKLTEAQDATILVLLKLIKGRMPYWEVVCKPLLATVDRIREETVANADMEGYNRGLADGIAKARNQFRELLGITSYNFDDEDAR